MRPLQPLSRGIERFTGITQAMVDAARPPEEVLPDVADRLAGRVLVAHNAAFDTRVLRQAFERCGLDWPAPPVICTVAMARRFAPLVSQRRLAKLAESLGIEVEGVHRALVDARTCARIFCALFPKLCAAAATAQSLGNSAQKMRAQVRASTSARCTPSTSMPREPASFASPRCPASGANLRAIATVHRTGGFAHLIPQRSNA